MNKQIYISVIFFLFIINYSFAQQKIDFKSKYFFTTEEFGPDIKVLTDSVVFFHANSTMYCDSALFNPSKNIFDAYGNVKIEKPDANGDTVFLYGDTLHYSGRKKFAKIRTNVILTKDSLTLTTQFLDYDLKKNIGYYFNNGTTVNGNDTLKSVFGYYYADVNELFFKKNVIVVNPKFNMISDTLKHNTVSKISYFLGPTEILSKENFIYCENGWYNHQTDVAQFNKNAYFQNKEKKLEGDSLYYDRNKGIGRAFQNVIISDTVKSAYLTGNIGFYNEKTGYSIMRDSAVFVQVNKTDSMFLHADTLCSYNDTTIVNDEPKIYRMILAYHKAKIYKSDLQAMCDSLVYNLKDSVIEMHKDPVLWSGENQLTSDYIFLSTYKNEVERIEMENNSLIISQSDSIRFNQIKGKDMVGYVENKELYQVNVNSEGKAIYFLKDDFEKLLGVNIIDCADMTIYLKDKTIDKIWYFTKPIAKLYPPQTLSPTEEKVVGFKWLQQFRPLNKNEIFIWEKEK
jgi:lipopolysaccharide export system protein LptA